MKKFCTLLVLLLAVILTGCSDSAPAPETTGQELRGETTAAVVEKTTSATEEDQKQIWIPESDSNYVRVADYIPGVVVELPYASADNFIGQTIYAFQDAYLRYGTVAKLMQVADELAEHGFALKIWDAFRPYYAQLKLWEICPDGNFVSNPQTGSNSHSRGGTVDVTLVDLQGNEVEMPSKFDEFSSLANRNYSDCTETAARNALLLQEIMEKYGFKGYEKEWWHYSDTDEYPVDKIFDPACTYLWYADCEEFISLRTAPSTAADVITRIPVGEEMTLLGWDGDFAMVSYQRHQGYVLGSYIKPTEQDVVRIYHQYVRFAKDAKPLKTMDLFYQDMDGDGLKELLFYYADRFGGTQPEIVTIRDGKAVSLLDDALFERGFFLCEDNMIGQWGEGSGGTTYWFYKVENQHLKNLDCLIFMYNEGAWYRSPDYTGNWDTMVPISEEERKAVAEQYIPLDSTGEEYMDTLVWGLENIR